MKDLKTKIEIALSYEATKSKWRADFNSMEFIFCSNLNYELFGKELNRAVKCECIEDFFLLLKSKSLIKNVQKMAEKKFKLKDDVIIQHHAFPNGITSKSSDEDMLHFLALNPERNRKQFEEVPGDWEKQVEDFLKNEGKESNSTDEDGVIDFSKMKLDELKAYCEKFEIEVEEGAKKADYLKAIEEATISDEEAKTL
jgi:hypothetical protein